MNEARGVARKEKREELGECRGKRMSAEGSWRKERKRWSAAGPICVMSRVAAKAIANWSRPNAKSRD